MAMYAAKRAGKNQVRAWPVEATPEQEAAAADRAEALNPLPAVARGRREAGVEAPLDLFDPRLEGALMQGDG